VHCKSTLQKKKMYCVLQIIKKAITVVAYEPGQCESMVLSIEKLSIIKSCMFTVALTWCNKWPKQLNAPEIRGYYIQIPYNSNHYQLWNTHCKLIYIPNKQSGNGVSHSEHVLLTRCNIRLRLVDRSTNDQTWNLLLIIKKK
jgi:hypothetical protein